MENLEDIKKKLDKIELLLIGQKNVLTFDEAAVYAGISRSYLYKLTSASKIPHSKPNGKLIYIQKDLLDSWLLRNKQKTIEELESEASTFFKKGND